jgi:hypothetical protein
MNGIPAGHLDEEEIVYLEEDVEQLIATAVNQTIKTKDNAMNNDGITEAAEAVMTETVTNAALISGEILLDNIETISDRLVLSRLSWWKRLTLSKADKEMAVTLATYAIVHAIKTGGFGLTKYRINHAALDYVTLAANNRLLKYVVKSVGVDTNIARMLLTLPTVSQEG